MLQSKLTSYIVKIAHAISVFMMILLAVTLFVGVLSRYVFSYSIPELEVLRNFSLMWLVFIGSALAVKEKMHLEIDIFSDYISERINRIRLLVVFILSIFGMGILVFIGIAAFQSGLNRTELVPIRILSTQPTLIYYYSAFLVGSILMLYFHLINSRELLARNEVKKK
ncbi:TRAP transporter small permease subunit [Gracilibacillus sp. S3-1-1]|uniref:TRAP transporter small permease subunit n=1 Tax=Gracilibacillus pellucidus TaxID=3095368 RepID=A0ACC6M3J1_9BACI|nr:TRAP transporter small permease subunit [Gracilibacillus sp. S3-1-1]MDX8045516.1 TRAP transporter small permease subunit [Gracilibacillus sp. S3-1-1]